MPHDHAAHSAHGSDASHGSHGHGHGAGFDSADMAQLLDLDAEVLHVHLTAVLDDLHQRTGDLAGGRILDLGAGSGTGTLALARRFAEAHVTALDVSPDMLNHLRGKAETHGLTDRVHTIQADLDAEWPQLAPVDLVWASASLHHLADPDRVLADVHSTLRPGGHLAVIEMGSFPRFLPDDIGIGRPGLEARCHEARAATRAEDMPLLGADWGPRLRKAGFTIDVERPATIELTGPLPAAAARYAQMSLSRMRTGLENRLSADDLATLDTITSDDSPDSVLRRTDLTVHTERSIWVARRP
jgi:SAM-dependent methyltransferase